MRHVTDGELHAYLDGALDLLPEGRGDEIREHVDGCPACRERLQDEEEVRTLSHGLLDASAPLEVAPPPFEELRGRAENAGISGGDGSGEEGKDIRYRGPLRGAPLAWAATVVLALGVGWMGGEVWRGQAVPDFPDTYTPETMAAPASEDFTQEREASPTVGGVGAGSVEARSRSVREDQAIASDEGGAFEQGVPLRAVPPLASTATAPKEGLRELAEENSLSVPGLSVISVEWEEWVPGEKALHIRQLLPPTDTLELRYLGLLMGTDLDGIGRQGEMGAEPGGGKLDIQPSPTVMEASLPPGWNQVVMKKGRGWLVARAPLPEASIRALLMYLR